MTDVAFEVKVVDIRERRIAVYLDRRALTKIILSAACKEVGLSPDAAMNSAEVHIEKETEGSPAYTVGYGARVRIVLPLPDTGAQS